MPQPRGSACAPPQSRRRPRRDWRALLQELAEMVPWPRHAGGPRTQEQVMRNVLGYIGHLQSTLRAVRGGAGPSGDTPAVGPSAGATAGLLVPEEDEVAGGAGGPWLSATGPNWDVTRPNWDVTGPNWDVTGPNWDELKPGKGGWGGAPPLTPSPRRRGLLGLSPSLLASPAPPGSPSEVARALFAEVCLSPQAVAAHPSPQAPVASPQEEVAGSPPAVPNVPGGDPGGARRRQRRPLAPQHPKKKCVNGFLMFCRLNRKAYLSAHPGLASTVATRELAKLWRSLSPDERRPYCLHARRFSQLHNRTLRPDGDNGGDNNGDNGGDNGDPAPPAPLQALLAAHAGALGGGPPSA